MDETKKQAWIDELVGNGALPAQETFTKEEVRVLVQTALTWASSQIEHTIDEAKIEDDDIAGFISEAEFESQEKAVADVQEGWVDKFTSLQDFILTWLA